MIARKDPSKGRCQSPDVPVDLDLKQQRDPSADELKKALQPWDAAVSYAQG